MTIWIPDTIAKHKSENRVYTIRGWRRGRRYKDQAWYRKGRWISIGGEQLNDVEELCFAEESEDFTDVGCLQK